MVGCMVMGGRVSEVVFGFEMVDFFLLFGWCVVFV